VRTLAFETSGRIFERDHLSASSQTKIPKYWAKIASCSFCGHRAEKRQKFVEGRGVYICDACATLCASVLSKQLKGVPERKYVRTVPKKKREIILCSFCGKERKEVRALFSRPGVCICDGCVDLCVAALSRQPKQPNDAPVRLRGIWCSFCGNHPKKGQMFVNGPGIYICDACVALGVEAISIELKRNPDRKRAPEPKDAPVRLFALCSFCGKKWDEVRALINGPGVYICDTCVSVSVKIIAGEWERAPGPKSATFAHLYRPKGWFKTPIC
jgi:ATP-dependent protease Clp ATPase subunit